MLLLVLAVNDVYVVNVSQVHAVIDQEASLSSILKLNWWLEFWLGILVLFNVGLHPEAKLQDLRQLGDASVSDVEEFDLNL